MAQVTVRFFKIERVHDSAPDLEVALQSAFGSGQKASDREKDVVGEIPTDAKTRKLPMPSLPLAMNQ